MSAQGGEGRILPFLGAMFADGRLALGSREPDADFLSDSDKTQILYNTAEGFFLLH